MRRLLGATMTGTKIVFFFATAAMTIVSSPTMFADGFQWMSKWKMPEHDANRELAEKKFGNKKLVVITGTSSGLGRKAALALLRSGEYHVIGAVRDLDKMEAVAEIDGFDPDRFTPMECELNSFESVQKFCDTVNEFRSSKPIDRLICNAGVYQPSLDYAKWSADNHEQTMQINFLSHFLMTSKLLPAMIDSKNDPRVIMVGSVTGNDNTVGGGGVYPIADLHDLKGFEKGFANPISMADGYGFIGAKAYKDSKLCLMMTANYLHYRYHKLTGVSFSSMYPGCIAESPLFREKRQWFRTYFPIFMKFITGGFVGEHEAGQRLFQVAHDPRCTKSGVYWSWNGGPREGRGAEALEKEGQISGGGGAGGGWDSIFENDQSSKVLSLDASTKLFETATKITNADWLQPKQITSPCPTLKVIGAVTKGMIQREELKRMRGEVAVVVEEAEDEPQQQQQQRPNIIATATMTTKQSSPKTIEDNGNNGNRVRLGQHEISAPPQERRSPRMKKKLSKRQRVLVYADRAAGFVLGNTVGRVGRLVGKKLLGKLPEEAKTGSYHPTAASGADAGSADGNDGFGRTERRQEEESESPSYYHRGNDNEAPDGIELLEEAIAVQLKDDNNINNADTTISGSVVDTTTTSTETNDEALFERLYDYQKN